MWRQPNTTTRGDRFSLDTVDLVWAKGQIVPGTDPAHYRKDSCGAWIARSAYGTTAELGWEIDHIQPVALGGSDALSNLQPLQWENNRYKSDNWPQWACKLRTA